MRKPLNFCFRYQNSSLWPIKMSRMATSTYCLPLSFLMYIHDARHGIRDLVRQLKDRRTTRTTRSRRKISSSCRKRRMRSWVGGVIIKYTKAPLAFKDYDIMSDYMCRMNKNQSPLPPSPLGTIKSLYMSHSQQLYSSCCFLWPLLYILHSFYLHTYTPTVTGSQLILLLFY